MFYHSNNKQSSFSWVFNYDKEVLLVLTSWLGAFCIRLLLHYDSS
jgi:hypothetical protein